MQVKELRNLTPGRIKFRRSGFSAQWSLHAVGNESMGRIIWRDTNLYAIADHDFDPELFHPPGKPSCHRKIIIALHLYDAGPKNLRDSTF